MKKIYFLNFFSYVFFSFIRRQGPSNGVIIPYIVYKALTMPTSWTPMEQVLKHGPLIPVLQAILATFYQVEHSCEQYGILPIHFQAGGKQARFKRWIGMEI